ncbi:hypothetical protein SAMN05216251_103239 [Actinacidiphila alni]|uniref:Glycosyltransferase RgtA/B/C/D-like domain-containing protein n=1 Tax=Actinacidiphila alni TaxID=380248 RepID=A0A1I2AY21_9ACTN|nr:hypothetical protein [Actinacidiphila alni]SFE47790.1 hypothetical protein SAMN05216251_103239 [Actinacidiphila alni]
MTSPLTAFRVPARVLSDRRGTQRSAPLLGAVCVAFFLLQVTLTVHGTGLGWDETVYTSQVSGSVPAAFFSAPRARGISFLAAPVAELTTSTTALRLWLAALSCLALYVALRVWRNLVPAPVLALAGGLFATLWITISYGPQVMPNLWSAYGALAAVGCFLRAARDRTDRAALAGLCLAVALTGLMRPPDAVWLVAPLAVAALFVPGGRRPLLWAVLVAGVALGCGEWVIEAYTRYGGLTERLHRGSAMQGGTGWNFAVDDQIRALDGRTLCRPCDVPWTHRRTALWWFVLPLPAIGGAVAAARAGRRDTALLPLLVASSLAVPYLFMIDYAAPRFLLPAYALLALPVAYGLWALLTAPAGRLRPVLVGLVVAALCCHMAIQLSVTDRVAATSRAMRTAYDGFADDLHAHGVRPPCLLTGDHAVPMAFYAGCASRQTKGQDTSITPAGVVAAARTRPVAVLVPTRHRPPSYARTWRRVHLPDSRHTPGYYAYIKSPTAPAR